MVREAGVRSTVIVDAYRRSHCTPLNEGNNYHGLVIHALPGLHAFAGQQAQAHVPVGAAVLDLGAGSGAMSRRLADLGFDVTASDYGPGHFQLHGTIPFVKANLNDEFSALHDKRYDAIVALEIIEHLENPRHFARECSRLLAPGGKLILSTPNIDSPASIASFIATGHFQWFAAEQYEVDGHITPLCQWQIDKSFTEAGFATVWTGSIGDSIATLQGSPRLKLLARLVRRLARRKDRHAGEVFVSVFAMPPQVSTDA